MEPKTILPITEETFGVLKEIELRKYFGKEDRDFTKWLAKSGLTDLSDALGLPSLELVECESRAGRYRVDILAKTKSEDEEKLVVIENQLEQSNHDHLGKAIVYAAMKQARHVIWIVHDATDEHRTAIKYLNERTTAELRFYLVEISLIQIDDSRPAYVFNVIESPDEAQKEKTENPLQKMYREFWNKFRDRAIQDDALRRLVPSFQNGLPQNYSNVHVGTTKGKINLIGSDKNGNPCIDIEVHSDKTLKELMAHENEFKAIMNQEGIEYIEPNAKLKNPHIRFTNTLLRDAPEKCRDECYKWFITSLLAIVPIVRDALDVSR